MYKILNESLITVISTDDEEENFFNKFHRLRDLARVLEVLKSYRFIETINPVKSRHDETRYQIEFTSNEINVKVGNKPYFVSKEMNILIGGFKYTVISVDECIFFTDDKDECLEYHMAKHNELLGKILS